jgi:hypothetical protein
MAIKVQAVAAKRTEMALSDLISASRATRPDRLNWQPLDCGRSVLDQLQECAIANWKWTGILRNMSYANAPAEFVEQVGRLTELEPVLDRLRETAAALTEAILELPDEVMEREIETPWGPYPLYNGCFHAYWNMAYHEGQINYIQTLYGDNEEYY